MKISRFAGLLILIFLFPNVGAQIQKKYKESGDALFQKGDAEGAAVYYQKSMEIDSTDLEVLFAYALALEKTNNYEKAIFYFSKVSHEDRRRLIPEARFHLAEMHKYLGNYDKALKEYGSFLKRYRGDKFAYAPSKATYEIASFSNLKRILHDTVKMTLSNNMPVNSVHSEFSGFFVSDSTLLFSSLRSTEVRKNVVLDSAVYYSRIYYSQHKNGWQEGAVHPSFSEYEKIDLANAVITPDGNYVYYSECKYGRCKLFRARNLEGHWIDFHPLPDKINLSGTNNSQPFLERVDGFDILYYVSDRKDGFGKLDIWSTIAYSNGLFGDPVNLGDSVNSPGNDICPFFMLEEDAIYFSSDWHFGLGGFDVFRSKRMDHGYRQPENLGVPVNTSFNDLYFRYHNYRGVITSNRVGSMTNKHSHCCNDLYFFEYQPKLIPVAADLSAIDKIQKLLPVRLYFDNDEPNPGSKDTTTTIIFSASHALYVNREELYKKEYSRGLKKEEKLDALNGMEQFFENEIKQGYRNLKEAMALLLIELKNGNSIVLDIKGYASPLSSADYNKRLTLRRISTLENEFHHFQNGAFKPYLESGQLILRRFPFGEDQSAQDVSDDWSDKRNAVYSQKAAFERRVEIIAVEMQ